jgi:hypothetical protein
VVGTACIESTDGETKTFFRERMCEMKTLFLTALVFTISISAFAADGVLVCDNLRNRSYNDASSECLRVISYSWFDQSAVDICNEMVTRNHQGTALVCLRVSKDKKYLPEQTASCMNYIKSDDPASAINCMDNFGEATDN